jgi:hypothetical protein
MKWALSGTLLVQVTGCSMLTLNDILQTIFLGVTAAGAYAILRNI